MAFWDFIRTKTEVVENTISTQDITNKVEMNKGILSSKLDDTFYLTMKKTLEDWRNAIIKASDMKYLDKEPIQEIYNQMMNDSTIYGALRMRISSALQTPIIVYKGNNITEDYEDFFNSPYFNKIMNTYLEAKFFGYNLFEIIGSNGVIKKIDVIDRRFVLPENHKIKTTLIGSGGKEISYEKIPSVFEIYDDKLGILNKLVNIWIYKKDGLKAFAMFSEKFGIPQLVGKTSNNNPKDKAEFLKYLKNIAFSSTAVINKDDEITPIDIQRSGVKDVYETLINILNDEIKKCILGSTMLMDDGSSYSQAEVHNEQFKNLVRADLKDMEWWINLTLLPQLVELGYIDKDVRIYFDNSERLSLEKRMEMDKHLITNGYQLDRDYLEMTYSTKLAEIDESAPTSEDDILRKEQQSKLKGSVGGVDGIISILTSVSQGITDYDSAIAILEEIYGFETSIATKMLGDRNKIAIKKDEMEQQDNNQEENNEQV